MYVNSWRMIAESTSQSQPASLRLGIPRLAFSALRLASILLVLACLECSNAKAENLPRGSFDDNSRFIFDCSHDLTGFVLEERRKGLELHVSRKGNTKKFAVRDQRGCTFEAVAESIDFKGYRNFGIGYVETRTGEVDQDLQLAEPLRGEVLAEAFSRCMKSRPRIKTYSGKELSESEKTAICHDFEVERLLLLKGTIVIIFAPRPKEKCRNPYFYLDTFGGTIYSIQQPCDMKKHSTVAAREKRNGG